MKARRSTKARFMRRIARVLTEKVHGELQITAYELEVCRHRQAPGRRQRPETALGRALGFRGPILCRQCAGLEDHQSRPTGLTIADVQDAAHARAAIRDPELRDGLADFCVTVLGVIRSRRMALYNPELQGLLERKAGVAGLLSPPAQPSTDA